MILLVDNAQQPMQAAPLALLRTAATFGCAPKLAIAFTHFDQVKGPNLTSFTKKKDHVLSSLGNAAATLRTTVGLGLANTVEKQLTGHSIFLGGLQDRTSKLPLGYKRQLLALIKMMERASEPIKTTDCGPEYQLKGLEIAMQNAIDAFGDPWQARLGHATLEHIPQEHWTRIKALSRRLANDWADEYDGLQPVADLLERFQEEVSRWLDQPIRWTRLPEDDDEQEIVLNAIREAVSKKLSQLTRDRLKDEQEDNWCAAYDFSGRGSAGQRSQAIEAI